MHLHLNAMQLHSHAAMQNHAMQLLALPCGNAAMHSAMQSAMLSDAPSFAAVQPCSSLLMQLVPPSIHTHQELLLFCTCRLPSRPHARAK